jgi:hypothetical protein
MAILAHAKHIATLGCSNSGDLIGNSWPVILADRLNCTLTQFWSNGAGNEGMNVEKFIALANTKPDAIFVSLTEISRFAVSLNTAKLTENKSGTDGTYFGGNKYYTINHVNNRNNLANMGYKCTKSTDNLLFTMIATDYNSEFKIFHTISTLMHIANSFDVPVYMFSWFDDIESQLLKKYPIWDKTFPYKNYLFDNAQAILYSSKFKHTPCYHWHEDAHTYLVDTHLMPSLISRQLV